MDIIIFGGQSNMQGQTECLTENDVVEGAFEYKYLSKEALPLKNPVGENITNDGKEGIAVFKGINAKEWLDNHALGAACYGFTNMVPEFCRSYIAATGRKVLAVHAAKGSTEVHQWLPGTDGYKLLKEKALAAKACAQNKAEHIYIVWLQGESDAIAGNSKSNYKKQITQLANALKQDIGIEKFAIIRVGRFTNDERDLEIISAQDEICAENPDFLMLTKITTDLNQTPEYMNPEVVGHYSAKGLELLGATAGKALGEYAKEQ